MNDMVINSESKSLAEICEQLRQENERLKQEKEELIKYLESEAPKKIFESSIEYANGYIDANKEIQKKVKSGKYELGKKMESNVYRASRSK